MFPITHCLCVSSLSLAQCLCVCVCVYVCFISSFGKLDSKGGGGWKQDLQLHEQNSYRCMFKCTYEADSKRLLS
jgi:hypothetical protein